MKRGLVETLSVTKDVFTKALSIAPQALFQDPQPISQKLSLLAKLIKIYSGGKAVIYGSADITNKCNLRCKHCYWWVNRKDCNELSPAQWEKIIDDVFIKEKVYQVALTGGEPLLRPDVIEVFAKKLQSRFSVVTNGTLELKKFHKSLAYYVSIDGTERIHDLIRGRCVYKKIKENVSNCEVGVNINVTINSINYKSLEGIVKEWNDIAGLLNFQFHTPFDLNDKLWVPFGEKRDAIINRILKLKQGYPNFIMNTKSQLDNLRSNEWTKECPNWAVLALDSMGRMKTPCCIGGDKKPICERCGICEYSGLHAGFNKIDLEWFNTYKNMFRDKNEAVPKNIEAH